MDKLRSSTGQVYSLKIKTRNIIDDHTIIKRSSFQIQISKKMGQMMKLLNILNIHPPVATLKKW
jgi:hypothetical protein